MKLPGEIYAIRKIVFNVEEIRQDLSHYYGAPVDDREILDFIMECAHDEFGINHFSLYDPEQDRDIA